MIEIGLEISSSFDSSSESLSNFEGWVSLILAWVFQNQQLLLGALTRQSFPQRNSGLVESGLFLSSRYHVTRGFHEGKSDNSKDDNGNGNSVHDIPTI